MVRDLNTKLRKAREDRGLTQSQVSKITGISSGTISNYELGECTPSFESIIKLANAYNCSIDYLAGRSRIEEWTGIDTYNLNQEQLNNLIGVLECYKAGITTFINFFNSF